MSPAENNATPLVTVLVWRQNICSQSEMEILKIFMFLVVTCGATSETNTDRTNTDYNTIEYSDSNDNATSNSTEYFDNNAANMNTEYFDSNATNIEYVYNNSTTMAYSDNNATNIEYVSNNSTTMEYSNSNASYYREYLDDNATNTEYWNRNASALGYSFNNTNTKGNTTYSIGNMLDIISNSNENITMSIFYNLTSYTNFTRTSKKPFYERTDKPRTSILSFRTRTPSTMESNTSYSNTISLNTTRSNSNRRTTPTTITTINLSKTIG